MRQAFMIGLLLLLGMSMARAQKYPERREIRQGNRALEKGDAPAAELSYRRALKSDSTSYQARFNLSNAMYKQGRYQEAQQEMQQAVMPDSLLGAQAHYNIGNALFQERKFAEAIDSYKQSLRLNPGDRQAKFNLAYAQKMLQNEQDKEQDKDKEQNQDKEQEQEKEQDQDKNQGDKNDPNKDPKQDPKPGQGDQPEPKPSTQGGMNPQEAERMLEAVQSNEENTKKKVDAQKVLPSSSASRKNW